MGDEWHEGISDELREVIHDEGFLCEDEIKTNDKGETWVKIDFFDTVMELLRKFKLIGEK